MNETNQIIRRLWDTDERIRLARPTPPILSAKPYQTTRSPDHYRIRGNPNGELKTSVLPDNLAPIPPEDLEIITKLYYRYYPDSGRKRGALLRYIRDMRNQHEPPKLTKQLIKKLLK